MWLFYSLCSWMSWPKEIRTQCHFTKLSCLTQPQPCFLFPPPNIYIYLITLDPDWLWVTTGEESGQWSWNLKQGWPSSVSWLLVADVLSIHPNLYFLISLVAVTIPEVFIEQCVRMVVLEQGCLCGCSGQWEEASFSGDNWYPEGATRALTLAHCVALNRLCPMWAQSQYLSLTLFFFFSQSQQENICFFYMFSVYLSWDLELCCCWCSVCFNSFEAIAVFSMSKLTACLCCLYVRSYSASACPEPRKKR